MKIKLWVNDKEKNWDVEPDEFLGDTLVNNGYKSVKLGCKIGSCGICTIWIDEKPMLSCSTLTVTMNEKHITTLEGIQAEAEEFANFLVGEGVEQCGFCSPGFVMLVLAMKRELKNPDRQEITEYLNGVLCRCSGYYGKFRAIEKYMNIIEKVTK